MKLALGIVLAAVVKFLWGFVAWGVLSAQMGIVTAPPNEAAVMEALGTHIQADGAYFIPMEGYMSQGADQEEWKAKHRAGPLGLLLLRSPGVEPGPGVMVNGFLHMLVSVLIAALILRCAVAALGSYGARAGFVLSIGVLMAIATYVGLGIWWYAPSKFVTFAVVDTIVAWGLVGLVLAAFVKRA